MDKQKTEFERFLLNQELKGDCCEEGIRLGWQAAAKRILELAEQKSSGPIPFVWISVLNRIVTDVTE